MRYISVLIGIILVSCSDGNSKRDLTQLDFLDAVISSIEDDLIPLEDEITDLARLAGELYTKRDSLLPVADRNKYSLDRNSWFRNSSSQPSSSTVFVSFQSRDLASSKDEIYITEPLDEAFANTLKKFPMVAQVFYNTRSQTSRVHPPYDLINTIDPQIDITAFNFFYLADEQNNATREHVWVDEIYIDPAGRGWILSIIMPVYHDDQLMGVLGIDVTLAELMRYFSQEKSGRLMIIDSQGTIVAGGKLAIEALSMPPLKNHTYIQTILADNFRREDFNLFKSKSKEVRQMAAKFLLEKDEVFRFELEGHKLKAFCRPMSLLGWYLVSVYEQA